MRASDKILASEEDIATFIKRLWTLPRNTTTEVTLPRWPGEGGNGSDVYYNGEMSGTLIWGDTLAASGEE